MSKVFFTSDEHLGHANIIKFCNRPYATADQMAKDLLERHNSVVSDGDEVYHLGDMFWKTFGEWRAIEYVRVLHGTHFYVLGNHEELLNSSSQLRSHFADICVRKEIRLPSTQRGGIVLDHYAGRVWHGSNRGSWQLYGHSHGGLPEDPNLLAFDVGVDCHDYFPVSLEEVCKKMEGKASKIRRAHHRIPEEDQAEGEEWAKTTIRHG